MKNKHKEIPFPEVNPNGSLLSPDTITYCNACHATEFKEVKACPECGSENVEYISGWGRKPLYFSKNLGGSLNLLNYQILIHNINNIYSNKYISKYIWYW